MPHRRSLRGAAVRERFGARVQEVVLFGSQARGEAHEESDVDVLIVIDDLSEEERRAVLDLTFAPDAASDEWLGLSPLVYSTEQAARMRRATCRATPGSELRWAMVEVYSRPCPTTSPSMMPRSPA